jgi:hypothetical protein
MIKLIHAPNRLHAPASKDGTGSEATAAVQQQASSGDGESLVLRPAAAAGGSGGVKLALEKGTVRAACSDGSGIGCTQEPGTGAAAADEPGRLITF